jgi:nitroreductase
VVVVSAIRNIKEDVMAQPAQQENPILARQSVRSYTDEKLTDSQVSALIEAFQASPCGMRQTDVLTGITVQEDQNLQLIESATDNACYGAPFLFLLATKKGSEFGERDASVAAENIMIEAAHLGLGSVYVMSGAVKLAGNPSACAQLGIPEGFTPMVIVSVGHPAKPVEAEDRTDRYTLIRK